MVLMDDAAWSAILDSKPVAWRNKEKEETGEALHGLTKLREALEETRLTWQWFAPLIAQLFPQTDEGRIHSPMQRIDSFREAWCQRGNREFRGQWWVKCDHELPVAGSIKARGGIYEVLCYAKQLAVQHQLLREGESCLILAGDQARALFRQYEIAVGSTGNLGLSIGIAAAALGFQATVHMSSEAKSWKKQLLRSKGVKIIEHEGDFADAVARGRQQSLVRERCYFVDDERSELLFLGYAAAAYELVQQLQEQGCGDGHDARPVHVYLPCGVGGSPTGIAFGLKHLLGDRVHCWFAEPVHAPSMLIGLITGKLSQMHIADYGLTETTDADGLAVPTPSELAAPVARRLIEGLYTVQDDELYLALARLMLQQGLQIEPSAAASLLWADRLPELARQDAIHISWLTGGALLPEQEYEAMLQRGVSSLSRLGSSI